eukprot:CAMPEP_0172588188 /NCGR_PEP_ID=MMETSP1068-20121228/7126_1 /TAXON_ID=35684 /ORGANISM="Pseudopedinella elastica, Strain CCMP716" /LENGTH=620 /DNA_ID=CAMNT_0013383443 /DNA_START=165 /DNA_END=2027 /DNA_ORIENTATION=-
MIYDDGCLSVSPPSSSSSMGQQFEPFDFELTTSGQSCAETTQQQAATTPHDSIFVHNHSQQASSFDYSQFAQLGGLIGRVSRPSPFIAESPGAGPVHGDKEEEETDREAKLEAQAQILAQWVGGILRARGGVVPTANLGSILAEEHYELYRIIKMQYGGLYALLTRFPDKFILADNSSRNNHLVVLAPRANPDEQHGGRGSFSPAHRGGKSMPRNNWDPLASSSSSTDSPISFFGGAVGSIGELKPMAGGGPCDVAPDVGSPPRWPYMHPATAQRRVSWSNSSVSSLDDDSGGGSLAGTPPNAYAHGASFPPDRRHQSHPSHFHWAEQRPDAPGHGQWVWYSQSSSAEGGGGGGVGPRAPHPGDTRLPPPPRTPSRLNGAAKPWGGSAAARGREGGRAPDHAPSVSMPLRELEERVVSEAATILAETAQHSLKAVELANTLRARLGNDALGELRRRCGGLLAVLARRPATFKVERIPKADRVALVQPPNLPPNPRGSGGCLPSGQPVGICIQGAAARGSSGGPEFLGALLLELMTTDLVVPTQIWHRDDARDTPLVKLIAELLLEEGGGCTVNKLRSRLKLRLGLCYERSVKTVPLKTFLAAYAPYFEMDRNRVTLARAI